MTSLAPTAADRTAIDGLKRDGHVLVFFYAPGIYRDGKLDETAMADFTGIKLRMTTEPTELPVALKPGHVLTDGLEGVSCGVPHTTFPTCYADDPAAIVLGTLPTGRAGWWSNRKRVGQRCSPPHRCYLPLSCGGSPNWAAFTSTSKPRTSCGHHAT